MTLLTATDFHQWVRCRRQWKASGGPFPRDMTSEVNLRETARTIATGQALLAGDARDLLPGGWKWQPLLTTISANSIDHLGYNVPVVDTGLRH
ncbi:hypothetical protein AU468_05290 [Alkalispirochaeta sphaeroplastigenens]|uniref:Uncharacterized protein n=1 Tax=Alkalispirochaeta sphaeroplastigenens TaxID=1187066 RepID=A0A2S4JVM1_9SPIO|nr:hypothetical protein [Alkalispirochaeta sphaeroplastigenens]POR03575.1 hypothetical protein AU468_05290 [Alkalispirochaeta sphaeroplastigenens]